MTKGFLLDTCAIIWIANFAPVSRKVAIMVSENSASQDRLSVSAMSAWEIGMLVAKGRLPTTKYALTWFNEFVAQMGALVLETSPTVLVASSYLPAPIHNDPTDRILIATAREHDLTIITRDRAILAYGAAGHVKVLAC